MATSPRLPLAAELKGSWVVEEQGAGGRACRIVLQDTETQAGHGLQTSPECLESLRLVAVVGWYPEPDGITLTRADKTAVAFFSHQGARRYAARRGAQVLVLRPAG